MKILLSLFLLVAFTLQAYAQGTAGEVEPAIGQAEALAKRAFEAHGGAAFGNMKTLSMAGSVDVTVSVANQAFPATFHQVLSGEKYRLELDGGMVKFLQTFDGMKTVTTPSRGFELPPINRIGVFLLQRLGREGFTVGALENSKKPGFSITSPEGLFTNFYVSRKTGRVKSYDASYFVAQRQVTTLVEIDKYTEREGIVLPSKFAQRFEVGGMTIYALFKTREIVVNETIEDELFESG